MNRFELALQSIGRVKGAIDDAFIRNIKGVFGERDDDVLDSVYSKSDLAYVCISTTARAISQVPLKIYIDKGDGTWEEDQNDPWNERIRKPNYLTNRYTFIEGVITRLMSDGDSFIVPFPLEYSSGMPISIWGVPKKFMKPLKSSTTGQLEGWSYNPDNVGKMSLPIESVCHMWFFNPHDPIMGQAPNVAGSMSIMSDYRAAKYNQLFFKQGASTKGLFHTDQKLTETQYTQLLRRVRERGSGMENAHRDLVLHSGLQYTSLANTHKEMEFKELRKFDSSRIMQIYGMKKSVISVTDDINRSISENDKRNWWQGTNLPLMRLVQEAMTFTFLGIDSRKEFRFDVSNVEALKEDFHGKVKDAKELWHMGFTANEINDRLELGFDEADWRGTPYVSSNVKPAIPEEEEPEEEEPEEEEPEEEEPEGEEEDFFTGKGDAQYRRRFAVWKSLIDRINPIEKRFESKTKRALYRYRQKVLEWLYNQKNFDVKFFKEVIVTDPTGGMGELWLKPYEQLKDEVEELYQESMIQGISTVAGEMGTGYSLDILTRPEAIAHIDGKVMNMRGVFRTVQNRITSQLAEGMEVGDNLDALAQRVKRVFNVSSNRAITIARTETYEAVNFSRNMMINESDFTMVEWFTAGDERVRETHAPMDGQTKLKSEYWFVGGASLRYPGDYMANAPEETINCRCIETVALDSARRRSTPDDIGSEVKRTKRNRKNLASVSDRRIERAVGKCY